MITLKTTPNKDRKETTVSAYDAKGAFICTETQFGTGQRVAVELARRVKADAERIQRAEQSRPAYGITSLPGMQVRQVVGQ